MRRTYDNLDRLTSETNPQGSVSYAYNANGRRTSMAVTGQSAVNYTYDNADRMLQITQGTNSIALAYDNAGRRTSATYSGGVRADYTYDSASRVTALSYSQGSTVLGNLTYSYDPARRRTAIGGSWARTGLPTGLASATYDAANQLAQWNSTALTYDANGNLLADGAASYTWNARNELVSVMASGMTGGSQYDAFGRRVSRTLNGGTTAFFYDLDNPISELSGGTPAATTLGTSAVDDLFTRTDALGTTLFARDALGSVATLLDPSGAVLTQYTYEPFGATTATGSSSTNPFQYTSRENDGTGLYYYRRRFYHPSLQRFISEDPLEFRGGGNFYTYTENDPVDAKDPFGLSIWYCTRPAFEGLGGGFGNHTYFVDDFGNDPTTMSSENPGESCGYNENSGRGERFRPESCRKIPGTDQDPVRARRLFECACRDDIWRWRPFPIPSFPPRFPRNDCQDVTDRCIEESGFPNPGAPGGRWGGRCATCPRPFFPNLPQSPSPTPWPGGIP